ncbi:hypothetical protein, partial [Actinomadura barringtoniae]|uniref:hypothetical protein n=1 Tax=Actinomadura barringtoniae TaxID=1427535 RepID=UPI001FB629B4
MINIRVGTQMGLDLAGLNPETPDLDLIISPPIKDKLTITNPMRPVTGGIHPRTGRDRSTRIRPRKRAGNKTRGGEPGTP